MSAKIGARSHPVYQRLCDLKKSGNAGRYGLLFSTQFKNYFYDTGTGKVLHIGDYEFKALQAFFDPTISLDAFEKRCHQMAGDRLEKFLTTIDSEKLLCAPPVTAMHLASDDNWLEALDSDLQQLVLEVTEACNFRCKYCIRPSMVISMLMVLILKRSRFLLYNSKYPLFFKTLSVIRLTSLKTLLFMTPTTSTTSRELKRLPFTLKLQNSSTLYH